VSRAGQPYSVRSRDTVHTRSSGSNRFDGGPLGAPSRSPYPTPPFSLPCVVNHDRDRSRCRTPSIMLSRSQGLAQHAVAMRSSGRCPAARLLRVQEPLGGT
jgi:hypothetical protein